MKISKFNFKNALFKITRPLFSVRNISDYKKLIEEKDSKFLANSYSEKILHFVFKNNPYYKKQLVKSNPISLNSFTILKKIDISKNFKLLLSNNHNVKKFRNSSGGSTGKPQTFIQDYEYLSWLLATQEYYFKNFLNTDLTATKKVLLWGSEKDTFKQKDTRGRITNWLTNSIYLNTFNTDEKTWLEYAQIINKEKPVFIMGYAGSLFKIAQIIRTHGIKIHKPSFLYSSAEMLRDFMRDEIETVFGAKVYDFYGSREVGPIAGECKFGKKHIFQFNNYVEIFDENNNKLDSGEGKIIITNLHNYSMPLIRYEIGDTGSIANGASCQCGSKLPYFKKITGRITDNFTTRDRKIIHGEYFTHLFYFKNWIDEFQVTQKEFEEIEIILVLKSKENENDKKEIEIKIRYLMGENCKIQWKVVDKIPKTAQGKFLFTRSFVN